ncbi:MAG: hypothetical protein IPH76_19000 [Xanthomonadales bacterium]|nr:hypothetical protein [Xanthomonadales bacterium]
MDLQNTTTKMATISSGQMRLRARRSTIPPVSRIRRGVSNGEAVSEHDADPHAVRSSNAARCWKPSYGAMRASFGL